ncbi:hypothetical protein CDCA_CDCA15G4091 [Cyanidium caldarium]|uniref:Probable ATP-dependent transporter ycf16 n=1 Tax=Cyanidium caldarium TaxID=2771 RepID=A0AAV9J0Y8_CYACA|nr:hypothetical protein CDCA_CDCA15G4091 [Cyanidium caldarium]
MRSVGFQAVAACRPPVHHRRGLAPSCRQQRAVWVARWRAPHRRLSIRASRLPALKCTASPVASDGVRSDGPLGDASTSLSVLQVRRGATYRHLFHRFQRHLSLLLVALLLALAATACLIVLVRLFSEVTGAVGAGDTRGALRAALLCVSVLTARSLVQFVHDVLLCETCVQVETHLRHDLVDKILAIGSDAGDAETGELVYRATAEVERVSSACLTVLRGLLPSAVQFVGVLAYMIYLSPVLTASVLLTAPLMSVVYGSLERRLERHVHRVQQGMARYASMATEAFRSVRLVQAYSAERFVQRSLDAVAGEMKRAKLRASRVRALIAPAVSICYAFTVLVLLAISAACVARGLLSAKQLVAFLASMAFLIEPIQAFVSHFGSVKEGENAALRLFAMMEAEARVRDPPASQRLRTIGLTTVTTAAVAELHLQDVWFRYPHAERYALRGVELVIWPGERVAIVGGSGSGKSTLVALLCRAYDPTRGCVRIRGVDVRQLALADVRRHLCVVPQDAPLLSGSVRDNITFGWADADVDDGRLEAAARLARAHDFIVHALPHGYDTRVGEGGACLSGGQRQRIAIARALYRDPSVLVLDEAWSALDTENEALVQRALEELFQSSSSSSGLRKTMIWVAHRLSSVRHADRIIVMEDGAVAESGTHEQLMRRRDGRYAALYAAQMRP